MEDVNINQGASLSQDISKILLKEVESIIKYVFYSHTREGIIQRLDSLVVEHATNLSGTYKYEESVSGFPEISVRWACKSGCAVRVANFAG